MDYNQPNDHYKEQLLNHYINEKPEPIASFIFEYGVDDALQTHKAMTNISSSIQNPNLRMLFVLLGVGLIVTGLIAFSYEHNYSFLGIARLIIWTLIGVIIVYKNFLKPYKEQLAIKKFFRTQPNQTGQVKVIFYPTYVFNITPNGEEKYLLSAIEAVLSLKEGVAFAINDDQVAWLPAKVFTSKTAQEDFVNTLKQLTLKVRQAEGLVNDNLNIQKS